MASRDCVSEGERGIVDALTHDGRGVVRTSAKTVFVEEALPGETILFRRVRRRRNHDEGVLLDVVEASGQRAEPGCEYFGTCGGCALQHLEPERQRQMKQHAVLEQLERIGRVRPETILPPLSGPAWRYRRRARLGVKDVTRKGRVLVGFRERRKPYVTDMKHCEVLEPPVNRLIGPLSELIGGLSMRRQLPQIEVAVADNATALVFRILQPASDEDLARLEAFSVEHDIVIGLQPGPPDTVQPLEGHDLRLRYSLPEFALELEFTPLDFVQINAEMNRAMIRQAVDLLEPRTGEDVLDLFCGLGNLTLPLATRAGRVVGVDGESSLIARARSNAQQNRVDNAEFYVADLDGQWGDAVWARGQYDALVLDPPRTGAAMAIERMPDLEARRVLYISCFPATLARDAGALVHNLGYRLRAVGVVDMFPHTAHIETMALFESLQKSA